MELQRSTAPPQGALGRARGLRAPAALGQGRRMSLGAPRYGPLAGVRLPTARRPVGGGLPTTARRLPRPAEAFSEIPEARGLYDPDNDQDSCGGSLI